MYGYTIKVIAERKALRTGLRSVRVQAGLHTLEHHTLTPPGLDKALRNVGNANHPRHLQPQGLFISSVTPVKQSISLQYLAPLPSTQPDDSLIRALSASQQKLRAHQNHPQYFSPYFCPYSLNAFTNNFALYRHHGCHWLA